MELSLSASRLRPGLFVVMALVIMAGLAAEILGSIWNLPTDRGVVPLLSLSYEWNVPTVYTAALVGLCVLSLCLLAIHARRQGQRHARHWWALAVGFGWIGLDELVGIHEQAGRLVDLDHLIHFDWVVPAAVLLVVLLAAFVPFLRHLPPRPRWRFVLAGALYVGGAVGMELPLGWWTARHGSHNLGYGLIDAIEESLEMLGLNLFLLALLDQLADGGVVLRFTSLPGASSSRTAGEP